MEDKIILYTTEDGNVNVSVYFENENFWLTQKAMAELFGCTTDNISLHLKNIFSDGELHKDSVTEKISAPASDGKKYLTQFYNLDAIIAVGYRVNSKKATLFRQWATKTLKEYIIKGFVLNDEMLKNGKPFNKDYFDELLERIEVADQLAITEYKKFRVKQDKAYISDFDKLSSKYLKSNKKSR